MMQHWNNWANNISFTPQQFLSPKNEAEVSQLLQQAAQTGQKVRIVGSGHSFTPLVKTQDLLLDVQHLSGLQQYDSQTGQITVGAGTRLYEFNQILSCQGRAMANLGDIDRQTVAGAISTGTHGTGLKLGSLGTQVAAVRLIDASGTVHKIDSSTPEKLSAARLSLGALGVITSVTFNTVPAYNLEMHIRPGNFHEMLSLFPEYAAKHRHFEFYWIPHTKQVQIKQTNISEAPAQKPSTMQFFNDVVLENGGLWFASEVNKIWPASTPQVTQIMASAISSNTRIAPSHEVFSSDRLVRFIEMEYAVPIETLSDVLTDLNQMFQRHQFPISFPIEVRCVQGDDIMLSTAHQRDSAYIAMHVYQGVDYSAYFREAEAIFRAYQGRPHWGKCHHLTAQDFEEAYPRFAEFKAIQKHFDPDKQFITPYMHKILFSNSLR